MIATRTARGYHLPPMRLILGALFITLGLFVATASAQVTGRVESIGFGGDYRPGSWTPMVIRLTPNGAPTAFYELRVWQHDLDGDVPYFSTRVSLTASAGEQPFWTYFIPEPIHEGLTNDNSTAAELAQRLRITIHDSAGKELAQVPVGNAPMRSIELPGAGNAPARPWRFVLFVGPGASPALADYEQSKIVGIKENLSYARVTVDNLPENVIGYGGIDAVVWLDGDPSTLATSGGLRFDALKDYVRNGGHLVLSTPANWQQLNGFDELMPVDISGTEINALQSPLAEITGKVTFPEGVEGLPERNPWSRYKVGQTIAVGTPRAGAVVDEYSDRIRDPIGPNDQTPWLVRRAYGFGCVSWVAQDLGSRELLDRANWGWPAVWELILGATPSAPIQTAPVVEPRPLDKRRYAAGGQRDFGYAVLDAMNLTGRGATLVGVTILFFIAYWALAGPGAFFWLKYKRRATLNWFAFGTVALIATAVTLGLVKLLLRGKPEVRHISLVRIDADRNRPAIITSRMGMYIPRDGAQRIEIPAVPEAAAGSPPTLTPFPIHPTLHRQKDGDKYLFAAPREYRVSVPTDETATSAVSDVPFRTTMKRLEAEWSGAVDDRIEGNPKLEPSASNVGYISGTLKNLTSRDLRNVYIAFRHEPRGGGRPTDWMMYVYRWKSGDVIDLAAAFNPQGTKTPIDITIGGDKRVAPNPEFPVRGWLTAWMEYYTPLLKPNTMGDVATVTDLDAEIPTSVPLLSFYNRMPVIQNNNTGAGTFDNVRAELLRNGLRDWDASNALMAGKMVIVAQADATPLPLPLTVDGEKVTGAGRTIYQFFLPLTPIPAEPTTKPTTTNTK